MSDQQKLQQAYDTAFARDVFERVERMDFERLKENLAALGDPGVLFVSGDLYIDTWHAALTAEIAKRTAEIEKRS